jgi:hypothetical protein
MMIPASAVLLSDRAGTALDALESSSSSEARAIARRARALKPILLVDCLHGDVVWKSAIPRALRARYGVENLYVEDLPTFWRLLYTIVKREGRRVVVVLEIVDHREYTRWFPGRKR